MQFVIDGIFISDGQFFRHGARVDTTDRLEVNVEGTIAATIRNYRGVVAWSDEKAHKVPLASSDRSRANLWCLKPGQGIHPHVHGGDHVWVVLEGTGDYIDGEDRHQVAQGDVLFVPAGLAHGIENTGSEGLVFVSISA